MVLALRSSSSYAADLPPTMSRTPANRSRKILAPRIASPLTSPRYWVITRPSRLGVVTTSIEGFPVEDESNLSLRGRAASRRFGTGSLTRSGQEHPAPNDGHGLDERTKHVHCPTDHLIPLQQSPL